MAITREFTIATRPDLAAVYARLGASPLEREQKLGQIILDFYSTMAADVMLGFFFADKDLNTTAMRQKQFMMRAMGASTSYPGKAPAQAHTQLPPILRGHFDRRLIILESVLKRQGLSQEDIQSWVGFENTFREGIETKG